jgi:hypothetical protein
MGLSRAMAKAIELVIDCKANTGSIRGLLKS